jgi:hypothetical protein
MSDVATRHDRSRFVQFGAGTSGPPTWRNFDSNLRLRLERMPIVGPLVRRLSVLRFMPLPDTVEVGDIVAGLPVKADHCQAIYTSHVLEHLCREDCHTALANTLKYLAPGGVFRIVLPDLRALAEAYLAYDRADAAHEFMDRSVLGRAQKRGAVLRVVDAFRTHQHLSMWDYGSLSEALEQAGFVGVRRASIGDSNEPLFRDVEDVARYDEPGFGGVGRLPCLAIECRKP